MNKIINFFKNKQQFLLYLLLIMVLVFLDQLTKIYCYNFFTPAIQKTYNPYIYKKIFPFLNFVLVFNKGIAFGVFNSDFFSSFMPMVLTLIVISIVCFLFYKLWQEKATINSLVFALIISGGIGNLIDRIRIGAVIDFIDFHIYQYHWPAFNLADSFVCIGCIIYMFMEYYKRK